MPNEAQDAIKGIMEKPQRWDAVDISKHSATPWRACKEGECSCGMIWSLPDDFPVFAAAGEHMSHHIGDAHTLMADAPDMVYAAVPKEVAQANAAFIVKAVNCHDELLAVVREACAIFDANRDGDEFNGDLVGDLWKNEIHEKLTAALAKAEAA